MLQKLKNFGKRTCFIVAASLTVAIYPATVSADQIAPSAPQSDTSTTQMSAQTDTTSSQPTQPTTTNTEGQMPQPPSNTVAPASTSNATPSASSPQAPVSSSTPNLSADTTLDSAKNATIANKAASTAASGDATVVDNTTAGNATTGNASVGATSINAVQSGTSLTGAGVATFTTDIKGNQIGDILIDPSKILSPSVTNAQPSQPNLQVKAQTSGQINNTIVLDAQSGNATVANNGTAGNATTGNANAVANVVNMVNSLVEANQSFIGTINIYGDLNGDILLPNSAMQALLSQPTTTAGDNLNLTSTTNQQIANKVDLAATSGDASVNDNGTAGNATTGSAKTNVTIMNLVGQQVVGKDAVVVFVNVLGTWLGFIVGAPGSTTTALVGGGAPTDPSNSGNSKLSSATNTGITNTITAKASSGNATVKNNSIAGNATTGNATASANILNFSNDSITLGDWFGILFINVFGSWQGAFGQDTAAGTLPPPTAPQANDGPSQPTPDNQTNISNSHQSFILAAQTSTNDGAGTNPTQQVTTPKPAVLGAKTHVIVPPQLHKMAPSWAFLAEGIGISVLLILFERVLAYRKAHANV